MYLVRPGHKTQLMPDGEPETPRMPDAKPDNESSCLKHKPCARRQHRPEGELELSAQAILTLQMPACLGISQEISPVPAPPDPHLK